MSGSKNTRVISLVLVAICVLAAPVVSVSGEQMPEAEQGSEPRVMRLTLAEVLELTETNNEEWELAELAIRRSQAARREALAGLLPQLNLSAGVTRQGGDES